MMIRLDRRFARAHSSTVVHQLVEKSIKLRKIFRLSQVILNRLIVFSSVVAIARVDRNRYDIA